MKRGYYHLSRSCREGTSFVPSCRSEGVESQMKGPNKSKVILLFIVALAVLVNLPSYGQSDPSKQRAGRQNSVVPSQTSSNTGGRYRVQSSGICGPDERTPSNYKAVGRLVDANYQYPDYWGTAWITSTGLLVTSRHCFQMGTNNMVEFNVPNSSSGGTQQPSDPKDRYMIKLNSIVSGIGGPESGDDWAVFKVVPNSQTLLYPIQAQQAYIEPEQNNDAQILRVTGYGKATGVLNQTQQTATGYNAGSSENVLQFEVDTQDGNSGSPIIDENTGKAIGVNTAGLCSAGSPNKGTSFMNSALWNAVHEAAITDAKVYQYLSDNTTSVGTVGRWNGESFNPVTLGQSFVVTPGIPETFFADQAPHSSQKYNSWQLGVQIVPDYDVINPHKFFMLGHSFTSHFEPVYEAGIRSLLVETNATAAVAQFKDPWLIDIHDNNYDEDRNQGMSAPPWSVPYDAGHPYNLGTGTSYEGVFVNQSGAPNWAWPYYSVVAPPTYSSGGITWAFNGWTATNGTYFQNASSTSTPVVFGGANSIITANYKGIHISNDASAFSNNSQRKLVATTTNGEIGGQRWLHQVYTSMNHVWLEESTDDGWTWFLGNNGRPLDNGEGKNPSIDWHYDGVYSMIVVAFQQLLASGHYSIQYAVFKYQNGSYINQTPSGFTSSTLCEVTDDNYSNNANPNIAWGMRPANRFLLTFEKHNGSNQGINWIFGRMEYCGVYQPLPDFPLPYYSGPNHLGGTTSSSKNATVSLNEQADYTQEFDIVYEENKSIKDAILECNVVNLAWSPYYAGTATLSSSTGRWNYKPSMIQMPDNNIRVCWIRDQMGDPRNAPYSVNTVYWNSMYPSSYTMMGFNAQSISLNVRNDNARTFYVFSDYNTGNNSLLNHASNGSSLFTLSTSGADIQLSNGPYMGDASVMISSAFNTSSSPYYFEPAGPIGSRLQKATPDQVTSGRGGTIVKGGLLFNYVFGNLMVDDQSIDFVDAPDSLNFDNLDTLNGVLVTEPFRISKESRVVFTEDCGFVDSVGAMRLLKDGKHIAYRVELVDDKTGKVLGTVRAETFDSSNVRADKMVPYLLDAKELRSKTIRAKITIMTNIDSAKIALIKSYSEVDMTTGSNVQSVSLKSAAVITDYALGQNYPNPFNPTTKIRYTIPKDGMVTLKVYDVLGREVETLVNRQQTVGRYEVHFDGAQLASGVYFYRLVSGSHVITKKMLLMK